MIIEGITIPLPSPLQKKKKKKTALTMAVLKYKTILAPTTPKNMQHQ